MRLKYHLATFGPPVLRDAAGQPVGGVRARDLAVLGWLARAAGGHATREALATLFWESSGRSRGRAALRQTLFRLRRALGDGLTGDSDEARLSPDTLETDADVFERALAEGRLEAAVELWRGDFLEGAEDAGGEEFRIWLEASRMALRTELERALAGLVDRAQAEGSSVRALAWAERWHEAVPLAEAPLLRLCELLRRAGRSSEALARLRGAEVRLRGAGLDPGDDLVDALQAVEAETTRGTMAATPGSAALFSPMLVGRAAALDELRAAWEDARRGSARAVLVEGEEGIGKTRLCDELLRLLRASDEPPLVLDARGGPAPGAGAPESVEGAAYTATRLFASLRSAPGLSGASDRSLAEVAVLVPSIADRFADLPRPTRTAAALVPALREVLACVAAETPIVLYIDDFHRADAQSRALLLSLAAELPDGTLLLGTSRTDAVPADNGPGFEAARWARLRLTPLSLAGVSDVLGSMLELAPADRAMLAERLHGESRGNPLFLVELVGALVDEGRLRTGPRGVWRIEGGESPLPVPSDVRAIIVRRLAHLDQAASRALSAAAVLEPPFAAGRLFQVAGIDEGAPAALHQLLARRLLQESARRPGWYELRHDAIRRVALETLTPAAAAALAAAARADGDPSMGRGRFRKWRRPLVAAAIVGLALATGTTAILSRSTGDAVPTVAVLPLANLSADSLDSYLAVGLAEELAARLGQLDRLRVLSPIAAEGLSQGRGDDAWAAGRALGVDYLVEGSVRRSGDDVRVSVRLTGTGDGMQLWSESYDLGIDRLLEVESRLASEVVRAVRQRLTPEDRELLARGPTTDPAAFDHYLRGNHELARRTPGSVMRGIEQYRVAARLDSSFAAARAREAYAYSVILDWGWAPPGTKPDEMLARALSVADEAIRLDPASADAWLARAYLLVIRDPIRAAGALPAFERAIALGPRSAEAFHQYGQTLMMLGRYDEAEAAYRNALAVEPHRAMSLVAIGGIRMRRADYDDALTTMDRAIEADPTVPYARAARAACRVQTGDIAGALDDAETALRIGPDYPLPALSVLSAARARTGDAAGAREALDRAMHSMATAQPSPTEAYYLGFALIINGREDEAVVLLERASPRSAWLWFYTQSHTFDAVRDDARFRALMAEVHERTDP